MINTFFAFKYRHLLAAFGSVALAACGSAPPRNAALDDARAAYGRASTDAAVVRSAPMELERAQRALQSAEAAHQAGDDAARIEHYAYLARQRTEVARYAAQVSDAEHAVSEASSQRDRILIDSRTQEADAQRTQAERARLDAEAQRRQAEAQRMQAQAARNQAEASRKLAEQRLAAANASALQAEAAREQVKSLEEQLAGLKAKQTKRGIVLTLGDVLFDSGRAELNSGAARSLDQLATFLKENPQRSVQIEGYTDSIGSERLNQALSERRAIAVKNALVDRGIAINRISARGFGETNPVASNSTEAGRQQNRRVEIVFPGSS